AVTDWLTVGGQAYYQSDLHGGTYASTTATVPGYWRFDAVARVRPTSRTELRLNVLNLTDKRYYDAIYRSSAPFAYVAPGRSATLSASIIF
ncbi:MAG: TonB-dependent siderophore receptor, partial [Sphingobium sp.]